MYKNIIRIITFLLIFAFLYQDVLSAGHENFLSPISSVSSLSDRFPRGREIPIRRFQKEPPTLTADEAGRLVRYMGEHPNLSNSARAVDGQLLAASGIAGSPMVMQTGKRIVMPGADELIKDGRIDFAGAVQVRVDPLEKREIVLDEYYNNWAVKIALAGLIIGLILHFLSYMSIFEYMIIAYPIVLLLAMNNFINDCELIELQKSGVKPSLGNLMRIYNLNRYFRIDSLPDILFLFAGHFRRQKEYMSLGRMNEVKYWRFAEVSIGAKILGFVTFDLFFIGGTLILLGAYGYFILLLLYMLFDIAAYFVDMIRYSAEMKIWLQNYLEIIGEGVFSDVLRDAWRQYSSVLNREGESRKLNFASLALENEANRNTPVVVAKVKGLPLPARYFIPCEKLDEETIKILTERGIDYSNGITVIGIDSDFANRIVDNYKGENSKGYLWLLAERVFGHELGELNPHSKLREMGLIGFNREVEKLMRKNEFIREPVHAVTHSKIGDVEWQDYFGTRRHFKFLQGSKSKLRYLRETLRGIGVKDPNCSPMAGAGKKQGQRKYPEKTLIKKILALKGRVSASRRQEALEIMGKIAELALTEYGREKLREKGFTEREIQALTSDINMGQLPEFAYKNPGIFWGVLGYILVGTDDVEPDSPVNADSGKTEAAEQAITRRLKDVVNRGITDLRAQGEAKKMAGGSIGLEDRIIWTGKKNKEARAGSDDMYVLISTGKKVYYIPEWAFMHKEKGDLPFMAVREAVTNMLLGNNGLVFKQHLERVLNRTVIPDSEVEYIWVDNFQEGGEEAVFRVSVKMRSEETVVFGIISSKNTGEGNKFTEDDFNNLSMVRNLYEKFNSEHGDVLSYDTAIVYQGGYGESGQGKLYMFLAEWLEDSYAVNPILDGDGRLALYGDYRGEIAALWSYDFSKDIRCSAVTIAATIFELTGARIIPDAHFSSGDILGVLSNETGKTELYSICFTTVRRLVDVMEIFNKKFKEAGITEEISHEHRFIGFMYWFLSNLGEAGTTNEQGLPTDNTVQTKIFPEPEVIYSGVTNALMRIYGKEEGLMRAVDIFKQFVQVDTPHRDSAVSFLRDLELDLKREILTKKINEIFGDMFSEIDFSKLSHNEFVYVLASIIGNKYESYFYVPPEKNRKQVGRVIEIIAANRADIDKKINDKDFADLIAYYFAEYCYLFFYRGLVMKLAEKDREKRHVLITEIFAKIPIRIATTVMMDMKAGDVALDAGSGLSGIQIISEAEDRGEVWLLDNNPFVIKVLKHYAGLVGKKNIRIIEDDMTVLSEIKDKEVSSLTAFSVFEYTGGDEIRFGKEGIGAFLRQARRVLKDKGSININYAQFPSNEKLFALKLKDMRGRKETALEFARKLANSFDESSSELCGMMEENGFSVKKKTVAFNRSGKCIQVNIAGEKLQNGEVAVPPHSIDELKDGAAKGTPQTGSPMVMQTGKPVYIPTVDKLIDNRRIDFETAVELEVNTLPKSMKEFKISWISMIAITFLFLPNAIYIPAGFAIWIMWIIASVSIVFFYHINNLLIDARMGRNINFADIFKVWRYAKTKTEKINDWEYEHILMDNAWYFTNIFAIFLFLAFITSSSMWYLFATVSVVVLSGTFFEHIIKAKPKDVDIKGSVRIRGDTDFANILRRSWDLYSDKVSNDKGTKRYKFIDLVLNNDENDKAPVLIAKIRGIPFPIRIFVEPDEIKPYIRRALNKKGINYRNGISIIGIDRDYADSALEGIKSGNESGYLWLIGEKVFGHELGEALPHSEEREIALVEFSRGMEWLMRNDEAIAKDIKEITGSIVDGEEWQDRFGTRGYYRWLRGVSSARRYVRKAMDNLKAGSETEAVGYLSKSEISIARFGEIYKRLSQRVRDIYPFWDLRPEDKLWMASYRSQIDDPEYWQGLVLTLRANGSIDNNDFIFISTMGEIVDSIMEGADPEAKKFLTAELIKDYYKETTETLRDTEVRLRQLGYGDKAGEIIARLIEIKERIQINAATGEARLKSTEDYYFIMALEALLGYEKEEIFNEIIASYFLPQLKGFTLRNGELVSMLIRAYLAGTLPKDTAEYVERKLKAKSENNITFYQKFRLFKEGIRMFKESGLRINTSEPVDLNYRQAGLLDELKDKECDGIIIQKIERLTPVLVNGIRALERYGIKIKLGFITDKEIKGPNNLPNVILGNSIEDIKQKAETNNVVYLANQGEAEGLKSEGLKIIEKGNAGLFIELTLALYILDSGDVYETYAEFLKKLVKAEFIKEWTVGETVYTSKRLGFIRLPKIKKVLDMWNELEKGNRDLKVWA